MKTLLITLEYPPKIGGIASYVFNLASHWPSQEEIIVYAPAMAGGTEFDKKYPWQVIRKKPYFTFFWPRWLKLLWQIRKIVKQEKIERIFVNHALPVGYVAFILKKILKISYYIFLHGTDLGKGTKNKWKKLMFGKVCAKADKIVVNSQFLATKFKINFDELNKKIIVLYPCPGDVFLKIFPKDEIHELKNRLALEGKKVILTVARMSEGKGYPHLTRILPKILAKVPNLVWLIIGDGPKKQLVLEMIQKNYLQNIVRFIGEVPYDESPKYFQVADLFVLLAHADEDCEEGWGTVFTEASACGLPIVAGQAGGVKESVENLRTGLLVDIHHDDGMVSAIVDLLQKTEYAKTMGENGRERAKKEFNWHEQIKKLTL